jgi:hypothetical protein
MTTEQKRTKAREYYWQNVEARRAYGRERARTNPAVRAKQNEWKKKARNDPKKRAGILAKERARYHSHRRNYHLQRLYGIDLSDYRAMQTTQNNKCAICGDTPTAEILHVDHDHATGAVRSLLCRPCNTAMGLMKENPAILNRAATYLQSFQ